MPNHPSPDKAGPAEDASDLLSVGYPSMGGGDNSEVGAPQFRSTSNDAADTGVAPVPLDDQTDFESEDLALPLEGCCFGALTVEALLLDLDREDLLFLALLGFFGGGAGKF